MRATALDPTADRLVVGLPEAARSLGIARETLRQAILRGEVPAQRVGAQYLVPVAWIRRVAGLPLGEEVFQ